MEYLRCTKTGTYNLTPWTTIVYSGYAHWDKPIPELEEAHCTREGARAYAKTIKRHHPEYRIEIIKED